MRRRTPSFSRDRIARAARARRGREDEGRPIRSARGPFGPAGDHVARLPYATKARRERERTYRRRILVGVVLAVAIHLVVTVSLAPFRQQIPLVRHIGYEGALRILPEISIQRPPGVAESDLETVYGRGSESFLHVIETREVESAAAADELSRDETGDFEEEYGDEIRRQLEQSLPQPTSRDVIVTKLVKPVYPSASIAAGVEGVVVFRLHVSTRGRVVRAWLLSSEVDADCEEAARRAVLQWRFRPHVIDGTAAEFLVDQRIRFRLYDVLDAGASGVRARGR